MLFWNWGLFYIYMYELGSSYRLLHWNHVAQPVLLHTINLNSKTQFWPKGATKIFTRKKDLGQGAHIFTIL